MGLKDKFNIKIKTVKEHEHDITYYVECSEQNCNKNYVGETGSRLSERVIDHNSRDKTLTYLNILLRGNIAPLALKSFVSWEVIIARTNFAEKWLSHSYKRETNNT